MCVFPWPGGFLTAVRALWEAPGWGARSENSEITRLLFLLAGRKAGKASWGPRPITEGHLLHWWPEHVLVGEREKVCKRFLLWMEGISSNYLGCWKLIESSVPRYPPDTKLQSVLFTQSCLTLCNPVDCSPPGSSVHGILQERILEWVAMPSSRGSSQPRDQTLVSCIAGRLFIIWATNHNKATSMTVITI